MSLGDPGRGRSLGTILGDFNSRPPAPRTLLSALLAAPTPAPPVFSGLEVDMFNVGKGDSILVTHWSNNAAVRVLIDGGSASSGERVLRALAARNVSKLDHVVCSHPHDDHAAGLVEILKSEALAIDNFWMHDPARHVDVARMQQTLSRAQQKEVAKIVLGSLKNTAALRAVAQDRRSMSIHEPFAGSYVGPLYVCGPSREFYVAQLAEFTDFDRLSAFEDRLAAHRRQLMMEAIGMSTYIGGESAYDSRDDKLGAAPTEPENESSVILWAKHADQQFLFTADAGVLALEDVCRRCKLDGLHWMQIPHHGSRRNLTETLIAHFRPMYAFVSADGSAKHPRKKVVDTFKDAKTHVYSTHHPGETDLYYAVGNVPDRGYSPATPL